MAQLGAMRGPAVGPGRRGPMGPVPKIENPGKILKRILILNLENQNLINTKAMNLVKIIIRKKDLMMKL